MTVRVLDHLPIIVRDLGAAFSTYTRLGFNPMPISHHTGRATANHIICFPDNYSELVGKPDPSVADPMLDHILKLRKGMTLLAYRSTDVDADRMRLYTRGVKVGEVMTLERPIHIPEYQGAARFRLVMIDCAAHQLAQVFLTEHLTQDAFEVPEYIVHPNGAQGILAVYVVADNARPFVSLLEKVAGCVAVQEAGVTRIGKKPAVVEIIRPEHVPQRWPGCTAESAMPYILGMRVQVGDVAKTAAHLKTNSVEFRRNSDDTLVILPEAACNVLLEFC